MKLGDEGGFRKPASTQMGCTHAVCIWGNLSMICNDWQRIVLRKTWKDKFFYAEKVCMLFLAVGLLAFAAQKEGILRDLLILSACSLSWKMVRAQFTAVNGFFRQNCVLLHSAGQCQINQYCGMNILVLPWSYKGEINNPPSNYWRNLRKLSTYQMKNNHVGKQRPCFCNLRNIIPNSGILVYPTISLYYGYMRICLRHTGQRVVTAKKHLKTPFFATPCRWDAPKVCPKWVTWRNRKLITAQNGGCGKGLNRTDIWKFAKEDMPIKEFWSMWIIRDLPYRHHPIHQP